MIVRCTNCGKRNSIPPERARETGRCGSCHAPIQAPALPDRPREVSVEELDDALVAYGVPVLIDFYSTTCGPCVALVPILERLVLARQGRLVVVKVNVEVNPQAAIRFGVRGVPVLVMTRGGQEVDRIVGAPSEADLMRWVDSFL